MAMIPLPSHSRYRSSITFLRRSLFAVRHGALLVITRGHASRFETFVAPTEIRTGNDEALERDAEVNKAPCCDQRLEPGARIGMRVNSGRESGRTEGENGYNRRERLHVTPTLPHAPAGA